MAEDLRARVWAAKIIDEPSKEGRRALISQVPPIIKKWVKFYVEDYYEKRKYNNRN